MAAGAFAAAALPAAAADFEAPEGPAHRPCRISYGTGSITHLPLALMQAAIAARTGAPVEIVTVPGGGGAAALEYVCNPPPNAPADAVFFHVGDLTTLLLRQASGTKVPVLEKVQPVGKISAGISSALIVADKSPFRTIDDFIAEGRKRPMNMATFGLELTMLERQLKLTFAEKLIATREQILAALASGDADASFLITRTVVAAPKVVALVDAMVAVLGEAADDFNFPLEITPASYVNEEGRRFERIMGGISPLRRQRTTPTAMGAPSPNGAASGEDPGAAMVRESAWAFVQPRLRRAEARTMIV